MQLVASTRAATAAVLALLFVAPEVRAQGASPGPETSPNPVLVRRGNELLEREDPVRAWEVFRQLRAQSPENLDGILGLGRVQLMLGNAELALRYSGEVLELQPAMQDAMVVRVRGLIRARQFDEAVVAADRFLGVAAGPGPDLMAARASALFRVQRVDDAAQVYQQVLDLAPLCSEAHLRLGSGLLPPRKVVVGEVLLGAVAAARQGELAAAIAGLVRLLQQDPGHPVAHRLLGEVLWLQRANDSMANAEAAFARLLASMPDPEVAQLPVADFISGYGELAPQRRMVVDRAVNWFGRHVPRLLAIGGRHDLLMETDRTTDDASRSSLRGKRTFDGRVWDDVRGIGGLRAATGIEALDEARYFGYDTLVHELAHQVHYFGLSQLERVRIRELYQKARDRGAWLDYYAASNEAEYFGQGVEAFASFGKRPGCETTHGHTRFELHRLDPGLHDFIASIVDHDPLADAVRRQVILTAALEVALLCGRGDDAVEAAGMMTPGPERDRWLDRAVRAREGWQER